MHLFDVKSVEPLYMIKLWDYAVPSFITAYNHYIGSKEDMLSLADNYKRASQSDEDVIKLSNHICDYLNGYTSVKNPIVYGDEPVLEPLWLVGLQENHVMHGEYVHKNIYNCDYKMRFAQCLTEHYVVQKQDSSVYRVYMKFTFINLELYDVFSDTWERLRWSRLCNRDIFEADESDERSIVLSTIVGLEDVTFDSDSLDRLSVYLADVSNINYKLVFDEVFGDM